MLGELGIGFCGQGALALPGGGFGGLQQMEAEFLAQAALAAAVGVGCRAGAIALVRAVAHEAGKAFQLVQVLDRCEPRWAHGPGAFQHFAPGLQGLVPSGRVDSRRMQAHHQSREFDPSFEHVSQDLQFFFVSGRGAVPMRLA